MPPARPEGRSTQDAQQNVAGALGRGGVLLEREGKPELCQVEKELSCQLKPSLADSGKGRKKGIS